MHGFRTISLYVLFSALVAALGGFLFGYHTVVVSGSLPFIAKEFQLSIVAEATAVSGPLFGAIVGTLIGGAIADAIGRKRTLQLALSLFLIATFFLFDARSFSVFLIGRLISGLAIGFVSVVVPLYIAEISPRQSRGALIALNQLMLTLGMLIAFVANYAYAAEGIWRDIFAVGLIPVVLQALFIGFIPESPSWLIAHGHIASAERVLSRLKLEEIERHEIRKSELVKEERREDVPTSGRFRSLFAPSVRFAFLIGVGISVIQQITGINAVFYYMPTIFEMGGFASAQSAIFASIWVAALNVVMTLVGLKLIDKVGRRMLALCGLAGMTLSLLVLGGSFIAPRGAAGLLELASFMCYVVSFALGLGLVTFVIISEIFPLGIRGRAMGIAMFSNWAANCLVAFSFLPLVQWIGTGSVFFLYAAICALSFWFVWKNVPETKDKTFEEIQQFLHKK